MAQIQDRTVQSERAGERYEAARGWLSFLIDHPDTTVSATCYRAQIKAAQKASNAAHKAMTTAMAVTRG